MVCKNRRDLNNVLLLLWKNDCIWYKWKLSQKELVMHGSNSDRNLLFFMFLTQIFLENCIFLPQEDNV